MKNLLLIAITMFSFSLFFSCGEENFEPYEIDNSSQNLKLLPSEITKFFTDPSTGAISTSSYITLDYNSKNQLISIQETLTGGYKNTYNIVYDENTNNVTEVSVNSYKTGIAKYTYKYIDKENILENVTISGVNKTYTLTLNSKQQLISKNNPDTGTITYGYDAAGNLLTKNSDQNVYDKTKGWMSSVQTPNWLFNNFGEEFPGTFNLINNIITDWDGNTYSYIEFNPSKYPLKIIVNNNTEINIKYIYVK